MIVMCVVLIGVEGSAANRQGLLTTATTPPGHRPQMLGPQPQAGMPSVNAGPPAITVERSDADAMQMQPGMPLSSIFNNGSSYRNPVSGDVAIIEPYPSRGATVRNRARPELDPLGLHVGGFLVYPDLSVTEIYNDNIFKDPTDAQHDFITRIAPRLRLESNWNTHALSLDVGAAIGLYAENPDESYEDFHVRSAGRLDINRAMWLDGAVGFERLHSDRGSPDDGDSLFPTVYYNTFGAVGFSRQFGDLTLRLNGDVERLDYDNNEQLVGGVVEEVDNSDRDRYEATGGVRLGYQISPNLETYLDADYTAVRYDSSVDDDGFDRDAQRHRAVAGISLDLGGITFLDLHAGYLAQDIDDPRLESIVGPDVGGSLTWNATGLTTVSASLGRRIAATTIDGASGSLVTEASVGVDHELRRDLLVGIDAVWLQNDYVGIDRTDNLYQVGLEMDYLVTRNLRLSAGYSYGQRDSNLPSAEYEQNLILVRIKAQY